MKRIISSFAAIALVGAMAATAMAQGTISGTPPYAGPVTHFDNSYLDHHPDVAQQLGHDPSLVNNQQFLNSHPGLDKYMAAHPGMSTELQEHPERFMHAESRYQHYENGHGLGNESPVAHFDNAYLDHHPDVAKQLGHDPSLVNNQQFLNSHPGLDKYMAAHPGMSTELQQHPARFMRDESRYGRLESHPVRNWRRGHGW